MSEIRYWKHEKEELTLNLRSGAAQDQNIDK